jgi:hypothetical protein
MFTKQEIITRLNEEYNYTEMKLKKVGGRYNGDERYEQLSSSNECLELLLDAINAEEEKPIQKDIYVISAVYNNEIIMTIGCFTDNKNKFQLNNFITRHLSKNIQVKNISMMLHSYAANLFNNKYIIVKEPLEVMRDKLLSTFPDAIIINTDLHKNITYTTYKKMHEDVVGCKYEDIEYYGIGNYGESVIIEITEEFKELHKSNPDVIFTHTKVTGL